MEHYMEKADRKILLKLLSDLDAQYNYYIDDDKEVKDAIRLIAEEVRYNVEDVEL